MPRAPTQQAWLVQYEDPVWEPLLELVGETLAPSFMWMHELMLEDGRTVQAYKHVHTRRYLFLAADSGALGRTTTGRYRPVDPLRALADVLEDARPPPAARSPARRSGGLDGDERDALHLVGGAGVERALGDEAVVVAAHGLDLQPGAAIASI